VDNGFAARVAMGTQCLSRLADPDGPDGPDGPDLIVLYTATGAFPPARQADLAAAVRAGAGLIAVHAANVFASTGGRLDERFRPVFELIGSRYAGHGPAPHESRFRVETDQRHPLTRGLAPFEITHEHYQLELAADSRVVAWRFSQGGREPIVAVRPAGRGRVCYLQLGHDMRAWDDPPVREILARGAAWAGREREASR
jgi:uncharacterized protein